MLGTWQNNLAGWSTPAWNEPESFPRRRGWLRLRKLWRGLAPLRGSRTRYPWQRRVTPVQQTSRRLGVCCRACTLRVAERLARDEKVAGVLDIFRFNPPDFPKPGPCRDWCRGWCVSAVCRCVSVLVSNTRRLKARSSNYGGVNFLFFILFLLIK